VDGVSRHGLLDRASADGGGLESWPAGRRHRGEVYDLHDRPSRRSPWQLHPPAADPQSGEEGTSQQ
jgi:hypothetical protein